jgi:hypothetical protein
LQQTCVGVFELPSSQLKGEKPNHVGDHAGEFRLWKTADGKFTVEAKLVTHQNKVVKLQRRDTGKIIEIGLEKLSAEDQEFAQRLQK